MKRGWPILSLLAALSACTSLEDAEWVIHPGEASDSIAVERGAKNQVCIRDPDTGERSCVPEITE
ncbi:MAG: hypothetical protein O3B72_02295 [Proteobacteria bacterium]|nr:hypothetical protein [Pseudomonadota bacterium]